MDGFNPFLVCILIAGIGVGSFHPAVYAFIDEATQKRKGKTFGMFEFWGSLAVFIMFLLHGFLFTQMNWRPILFITSLPGLVMGGLFFLYSGEFRGIKNQHGSEVAVPAASYEKPLLLFVLFLAVVTLRFFAILAVVNFTPTFLVFELGLGKSIASYATGLYFLGGLVATPIVGTQCDARNPLVVLLLLSVIPFPLILLISIPHPLWLLPLIIFIIGATYWGASPAMDMIITRMSSTLGKGEAFGYFSAITAVAYSVSPLLFGLLADKIGLTLSMRFFSIPLLISTALLFWLHRIMKKNGAD
jgi:MFS family permease